MKKEPFVQIEPKFKVGDKVRKTRWDKDTTISGVEWHGTWETFVYHFKEQEYGFNCHMENDLTLVSKRVKDPNFSIGEKVQLQIDWCGLLKGTLLTIKDIPTIDRDNTFMYSFEETNEYIRETLLKAYTKPKPKFKIGDKVYQTVGHNRLDEYTIKKVYTDKTRGIVYDIQGLIGIMGVRENNLCLSCQNPYTEPESLNLSQETANCDKSEDNQLKDNMEEKELNRKALYDALCELETASVKVRKALIAM